MSFKILSFDIGIKNLAYCIIEYNKDNKTTKIIKWDIINLLEDEVDCLKCCGILKNNSLCNKNCKKYIIDSCNIKKGYCGTHIKKITDKIYTEKKINANKININILIDKLVKNLDYILLDINDVDDILIENQPALKNPKMKTIQIALYMFFLIREKTDNNNTRISNIIHYSATNKLKVYNGPIIKPKAKKKYDINKELSVIYTKYMINDQLSCLDFFNNSKKKDDLADCYLQGMYYIYKKFKLL